MQSRLRAINRKSTPGVIAGRVQNKNNRTPHAGDYYRRAQREIVVDRQRPGNGYRHLLTVEHVRAFVGLLPDEDDLTDGLNAVVLAPGEQNTDGWHTPGIVAVCAWERDLWRIVDLDWYEAHRDLLDRIGVLCKTQPNGDVVCCWTEDTARAYQLLHVLLHELGHHHDRITTRSRRRAARGESYAETYALRNEPFVWDRYWQRFNSR